MSVVFVKRFDLYTDLIYARYDPGFLIEWSK
jgi:hypothetical protein